MKVLLGITPQGVVSFVFEPWGGRVSDKHLTEHCGILDKLLPGDVVLADRGIDITESIGMMQARAIIDVILEVISNTSLLALCKHPLFLSRRIGANREQLCVDNVEGFQGVLLGLQMSVVSPLSVEAVFHEGGQFFLLALGQLAGSSSHSLPELRRCREPDVVLLGEVLHHSRQVRRRAAFVVDKKVRAGAQVLVDGQIPVAEIFQGTVQDKMGWPMAASRLVFTDCHDPMPILLFGGSRVFSHAHVLHDALSLHALDVQQHCNIGRGSIKLRWLLKYWTRERPLNSHPWLIHFENGRV